MTKRRKGEAAERISAAADARSAGNPSVLAEFYSSSRLAALLALVVATVLIPSEGAIISGSHAPVVMLGTVLLLAIALLSTQQRDFTWRLDLTDGLGFGLIGWHSVSAIITTFHGNGRSALNALWIWIYFGLLGFLFRRLLPSDTHRRGVIAVMIALGAMLSTHGFYQYFISFPQMRAEFAAERERLTAGTEQAFAPGTPEFELLGARVRSPEPLATFALTNSLAGYLAPWLIATAAVGMTSFLQLRNSLADPRTTKPRFAWGTLICSGIVLGLVAGCLLLTQSRAGMLAVVSGLVLLVVGEFSVFRQWSQRSLFLFAGIVAAGGLLAIVGISWNSDLWLGAPTSLRYRLEYWHATLRLIGDHPLLGCGPGNFQEHYTRYKLPQASETIADPHNFLLEIAATAGLPALLAWFALVASIAWKQPRIAPPTKEILPQHVNVWPLYWGALAGIMLAIPLSILVGLGPETFPQRSGFPVYLLFGLPVAAAILVGLHHWVVAGNWQPHFAWAILATLLVNLLAAGSTGFPGVFQTSFVMLAFLFPASQYGQDNSSWRSWLGTSGASILAVACYFTLYRPVLNANYHQTEAFAIHTVGRTPHAAEEMLRATRSDPWSPEPWQGLTELRLQLWMMERNAASEQAFETACDRYAERTPHSYRAAMQIGQWRLRAYRISGRDAWLSEAVRAYEQAIERYPNHAFAYAQLAWVHRLRGDDRGAKNAALRAIELDDLHSHGEQKLAARRLEDLPADQTKTPQPLPEKTAREIVEMLAGTEPITLP